MRIKAFGLSDVGKKREKNEDSFLINADLMLYAVADGMGGHLGGDIASRMAIETLETTVKALEVDPESTLEEGTIAVRPGEYQGYLRYAIALASQRIYERSKLDQALSGMGTTSVVLLFRNNKVYIANVGDSRVYRVRGEKIVQITRDHSLVGEQMRAGIISPEDARSHRLKNVITRSVGFQEDVEADIDIRVLKEGDRFLLCSDGLCNMLDDGQIRDIASTNDLEPACRRLVDLANERGGDDNITVVMTEVESLSADPMPEPPPDDSTMEL